MQDEQIRILCQHAVKYAPNGISAEAVADALGMRYATLMSQLSAQPGHKLGAEIVLPIMQLTGCWLALALVWNVSNRRHIRRLQQTLQEREQKQ